MLRQAPFDLNPAGEGVDQPATNDDDSLLLEGLISTFG
jgi:hypothetical protein